MATPSQINKRLKEIADKRFGYFERLTKAHEKLILNEYVKIYNEIDALISGLYKKFDELTIAEMAKFKRNLKLQEELKKTIKTLYPKTNLQINKAIKDNISMAYYSQGYSFESTLAMNLAFTSIDPNVLISIASNKYGFINWQDSNLMNIQRYNQNVSYAINQGVIQGESYAKMTKRLREQTVKASLGAKRIIWTECHRAQMAGTLIGMNKANNSAQAQGVEIKKMWISTLDERTRESHGEADGQIVGIDEDFEVGGVMMPGPGMSGDPHHDILCRCDVGQVIDEKMPKERFDQLSQTKIKYETYTTWAKGKKIKIAA